MTGSAQIRDAAAELAMAYRLRWKRRRLLWRSWRKRRQLSVVVDRTAQITRGAILGFSTVRNEAVRLPYWLEHHRALGVDHFLIVDNASDDSTRDYLVAQPDVSLWRTPHSYRLSRFGVDWLTWLQMRHGHGHWCLTADADELLIYPFHDTRPLPALTEWLDGRGIASFGALMLDMYPKGRLSAAPYAAGQDPREALPWFDAGNYMIQKQKRLQNLWIQGGPRARSFFAGEPRRAPTMGKVPLVKWHRGYAYVSSAHSALPRRLNHVYDEAGGEFVSGVLLHTKFLSMVTEKSAEEKERREHFANSSLYDAYYDSLTEDPDLWCEGSTRYRGWRQLEALGLMSRGTWL
ncbi:Glycosyl transferase family 2 [Roseovarius nanhaiticus]|uniref:Glycosyl transferase family 2 n=1 Tax=Roseovarius nanhaiticus TaxID=573024 RepID=A0A1N7E7X5_9RHOB|nr:glycosyltransferase family 2 protein [Roseovarius nanhaiticus]SEK79772.1 Glycosyl transferase family 2 [Roseovarius nanhaiticus]SIR84242.1 Glycosyl transferase family 2 [Roseovarius nanhaiticus]